MGSANGPVEKMHWRTAPTPCPEISARIGYAIPARNNNSVGGGISANATTWIQTFLGGASTSIEVLTSKVSAYGFTQRSAVCNPGLNRKMIHSIPRIPFFRHDP